MLPEIIDFVDLTTGLSNLLTNEGMFAIFGNNLSFDESDSNLGFFVNNSGQLLKCEVIHWAQSGNVYEYIVLNPIITGIHIETEILFITRAENGATVMVKYPYVGTIPTSDA